MSDFLKRIGSFLKKRSLYGAGIFGTAVITANVMCRTNLRYCRTEEIQDKSVRNKEIKNNTDEIKKDIYDLEEIGKKIAWTMYKPGPEPAKSATRKQNEPVLKLNWDDVKSFPGKPKYQESSGISKKSGQFSKVIFEADFQNKSNKNQRQNLKVDVETLFTSESFLTKGYTKGSEVGLSLDAPDEIVSAASPFSQGLSLKYINGNFEVIPVSWVIDKSIRVPKKSKITVSKRVKEHQREFDFEAKIGFEGDVKGTFYNETLYSIPIMTIIKELPEDMRSEENDRFYIKINGRCTFKYDTEQDIQIK